MDVASGGWSLSAETDGRSNNEKSRFSEIRSSILAFTKLSYFLTFFLIFYNISSFSNGIPFFRSSAIINRFDKILKNYWVI